MAFLEKLEKREKQNTEKKVFLCKVPKNKDIQV